MIEFSKTKAITDKKIQCFKITDENHKGNWLLSNTQTTCKQTVSKATETVASTDKNVLKKLFTINKKRGFIIKMAEMQDKVKSNK